MRLLLAVHTQCMVAANKLCTTSWLQSYLISKRNSCLFLGKLSQELLVFHPDWVSSLYLRHTQVKATHTETFNWKIKQALTGNKTTYNLQSSCPGTLWLDNFSIFLNAPTAPHYFTPSTVFLSLCASDFKTLMFPFELLYPLNIWFIPI